jgi:hypothetical protein
MSPNSDRHADVIVGARVGPIDSVILCGDSNNVADVV